MEANIIRYQFNPPALNQGLGFRLFGKPITWRSILKTAATRLINAIASYIDGQTGGMFRDSVEEYRNRALNWVTRITGPAPATITQRSSATTPLVAVDISEDEYLANWVTNKLTPFCNAMIAQLAVLNNPNATLLQKMAGLNQVTNKIDTVQDHLAQYDFYDLSAEGVDNRSALLAIAFEPIYNVVKAAAAQLNLVTFASSFNPQGTSFAPLFTNTPLTQVPTEMYKARAGVDTSATTTGTGTSTGTGTGTSSGTSTGTITIPGSVSFGIGTGTGIPNAGTTVPKTRAQTEDAPSTPTPEQDGGSNTVAYVAGGAIALGILYAIFKPKPARGLTGPRRGRRTKK
nr:hypothetical protein [uncultured Flavobacterium sp.]